MKKVTTPRIERPFLTRLRLAIEIKQRRAAGYLGRKTQCWNRSSKLIALALFCLVFGGISLAILLTAILHK